MLSDKTAKVAFGISIILSFASLIFLFVWMGLFKKENDPLLHRSWAISSIPYFITCGMVFSYYKRRRSVRRALKHTVLVEVFVIVAAVVFLAGYLVISNWWQRQEFS